MPKSGMAISTHHCLFHPAMWLETQAAMRRINNSYGWMRAYLYQVLPVRQVLLSHLNFAKLNHLPEAAPLRSGLTPEPQTPATSLYRPGALRDLCVTMRWQSRCS